MENFKQGAVIKNKFYNVMSIIYIAFAFFGAIFLGSCACNTKAAGLIGTWKSMDGYSMKYSYKHFNTELIREDLESETSNSVKLVELDKELNVYAALNYQILQSGYLVGDVDKIEIKGDSLIFWTSEKDVIDLIKPVDNSIEKSVVSGQNLIENLVNGLSQRTVSRQEFSVILSQLENLFVENKDLSQKAIYKRTSKKTKTPTTTP